MNEPLENLEPKLKERPRWQRILLKGLLVIHLVSIISWTLPTAAQAVRNKTIPPSAMDWPLLINEGYVHNGPVKQYIYTTGTWQGWDMFSPNPSDRDVWGSAEIDYADGSTKAWSFPRMKEYNFFWRYEKERYRKYFERVNVDEIGAWLRPDCCLWIARQNYTDPANPPVKVRLYNHLIQVSSIPPFSDYLSNLWKATRAGKLSMEAISPKSPINAGPYTNDLIYEIPIDKDKL